MASITVQELRLFHTLDREIFGRLVIRLMRHPGESLLVMALWLWLENKRFPKIVAKMVNHGDFVLHALAKEASKCLQSLNSGTPPIPLDGGMPLTTTIMGRDISFQMIYRMKYTAMAEIKLFLNEICAFIFTDILQQVLAASNHAVIFHQPLIVPGFPHPLFGPITITHLPLDHFMPPRRLSGWSNSIDVPVNDRTLFLTFSRGYPVTEAEVRELFTIEFGDCVDYVKIDEFTSSDERPLFARMAVRAVSTIDEILNGKNVAKFRINGKHVWARKYERRDNP